MRQSLLAATFLLSLFSPTLAKADEAIRQWKGFNLGLSIGLAETDANSDGYAEGVNTDGAYWAPADLPTVNSVVEQDISTDSVVGGLDLGYNLQAGHLVLGLDGGAYATNTDKTIETFSVYPSNANGFTIRSAVRSNWFVKLAPKVGYIYRDFLFELSGGLAFASITTSFDLVQEANNGRAFAENNKSNRVGSSAPGCTTPCPITGQSTANTLTQILATSAPAVRSASSASKTAAPSNRITTCALTW